MRRVSSSASASGNSPFRPYIQSSIFFLQFDERDVLEMLAGREANMGRQQNGAAPMGHQQNGTAPMAEQQNGASAVEDFHKGNLVEALTEGIAETYQTCNPNFILAAPPRRRQPSPSEEEILNDELDDEEPYYPTITSEEVLNSVLEDDQRRYLTFPSEAVSNDGLDNINDDLILYNDLILRNLASNTQYVVKEMLGQGSFGQVCRCTTSDPNWEGEVAVKVVKNRHEYGEQGVVEAYICTSLKTLRPGDLGHIVQILDNFVVAGHVCLVFELLSINLYEVLKRNKHKGFSIRFARHLTIQMLEALEVLQEADVIHCDLKPENIVLKPCWQQAEVKVIDFGSSYMKSNKRGYKYDYMMSRHYRAPEVLLKMPWSFPIDMWSLGCIAAELFLGIPLFPGECEYDLLRFMIEVLECQPPDHMIQKHHSNKENFTFFKLTSSAPLSTRVDGVQGSPFKFLSIAEIAERERARRCEKKPREWDMSKVGKCYHGHRKTLTDIILDCPIKTTMTQDEQMEEPYFRLSFVHLLKGILRFDPETRWTPREAMQHPFITGKPFVPSFEPRPDRMRTCKFQQQGVVLEHNVRNGHWLAASPSHHVLQPWLPNGGTSQGYQAHQSPYNNGSHQNPYNDGGHCSAGSNGMQVDGPAFGSSPVSYGDYPAQITRSGPYGTGPGPGVNGHSNGGRYGPQLLPGTGFVGSPEMFHQQGGTVSNGSAHIEAGHLPCQPLFPLGMTPSPSHHLQNQSAYSYYSSPNNSSGFASPHSTFAQSPWPNASPVSTPFHMSPNAPFSSPPNNPLSMHNSPSSRFAPGPSSPYGRSAAQNIPQSMVRHRPNGTQHQRSSSQNPNTNGNESFPRGYSVHGSTSFPPRHRNSSYHTPPETPTYRDQSLGAMLMFTSPDTRYKEHAPPPGLRHNLHDYPGEQPQQHGGEASSSSNVTDMEVNAVSSRISRLDTRGT